MQELWYWVEEREAYRSDYAKLWNDSATAVDQNTGELGGMADTAKYCSYTSQWNLLDYPAVSFPVDKVDKRLDGEGHRSEFLGQLDWENWELCKTAVPLKVSASRNINQLPGDPEVFDGLPISLQLVGRRLDDEKILAVLGCISGMIGLPFAQFP